MENVAKCMKGFERGRVLEMSVTLLEMSVTLLLSSARDMTRRHNIKMHCWDLNWIRSDQAAVAVGGEGEESWDRKYKKGLYKQEKRVHSFLRRKLRTKHKKIRRLPPKLDPVFSGERILTYINRVKS
jgi:hypothetical protein